MSLISKNEVKRLGWYNVVFPNGNKDPNCIIETKDGEKYACNEFPNGFEVRFQIKENYKLEKIK